MKYEYCKRKSDPTHFLLGGGGGGELGLAVSAIFLNRFFGACANKRRLFGFGVHCSLQIFCPKHLVFGIRKKHQ